MNFPPADASRLRYAACHSVRHAISAGAVRAGGGGVLTFRDVHRPSCDVQLPCHTQGRNPRTVPRRVGAAPCPSQQEAVLKATAVRGPLPIMSPILSCPHCLLWGGSGGSRGRGSKGRGGWGGGLRGGAGRGHFICLAIYCTTIWCFAPKGLRTTKCQLNVGRTRSKVPLRSVCPCNTD